MAADPARRDARPIVWMIGFLVIALVVYFVILGQRGFDLISSGTVAGIAPRRPSPGGARADGTGSRAPPAPGREPMLKLQRALDRLALAHLPATGALLHPTQ